MCTAGWSGHCKICFILALLLLLFFIQLSTTPDMMAIGLLAVAAIPSTIGVCQALSAQKKQNANQKEKVKFMATAELSIDGEPAVECPIVLINGKVSLL